MPVTAACLSLHTPTAPMLTQNLTPKAFSSSYRASSRRMCESFMMTCRASSTLSSSITDFDLYDLLGIDSCCNQSQIKMAYRALQKRCHPDIAGPAGHDMAIILNQAYSVLSDPYSRLAYDKEQAKMAELRGYTGKPMYSVWFGSQSEERAVFVDEVKCVGCLKCALFAENTFAIESAYGRARVVAQWADPEHKIQSAIESCPVDCISIVERTDLAALEFLMSKQPRCNVQVGAGNSAGARVSNIFIDVKKFRTRFADAMHKASNNHSSKEADQQREARMSAVQAIRSISNWLYWQSPKGRETMPDSHGDLIWVATKSLETNINKLREAAATRRLAAKSRGPVRQTTFGYVYHDEYWIPKALPASTNGANTVVVASEASPTRESTNLNNKHHPVTKNIQKSPIRWGAPLVIATIAAIIVQLEAGQGALNGLNEHIGGSLALEVVNSLWLQIALAGITWHIIGMTIVELAIAIRNRL